MKVKKTRKGNAQITLTMSELDDLHTLLCSSHYTPDAPDLDESERAELRKAEKVSPPLCRGIVNVKDAAL